MSIGPFDDSSNCVQEGRRVVCCDQNLAQSSELVGEKVGSRAVPGFIAREVSRSRQVRLEDFTQQLNQSLHVALRARETIAR